MSTIWETFELPSSTGSGWEYDDEDTAYDSPIDDETGHVLRYDGEGTPQTWSTQTKS